MKKRFCFLLLSLSFVFKMEGQCIHFDPSPNVYINNSAFHADLDWNDTTDFDFFNVNIGAPQYNFTNSVSGTDSNKVLCDATGPLKLNYGDSISLSSQTWNSGGTFDLYMSMSYYSGNWDNINSYYAGLKFVMNGRWHYGWIRAVASQGMTLYEWGYNLQPDSGIIAGCADVTGISSYKEDFCSVFSSGQRIKLSLGNGIPDATFKLYNSSGQLVLQQTLNAPEALIDCAELAPGIYFAEVCDGERLFSQKILLTGN